MYNRQLETFLHVADAGSFSKAAAESYISSNAVIKQINLLEDALHLKLFERSHQGVRLTQAGRSLYRDAQYIISYCRDAVMRAQNAMQEDGGIIRVGTSPMTPAQLLMPLWEQIRDRCPHLKFQIVPYENTPENARELLAHLGTGIDIVGGIFDTTMLELRHCAGLELSREPFCCAVSIHHPLSAKSQLTLEDLYNQNLLLMRPGWSHYVDRLRADLQLEHPCIHIVDFDFYNTEVFNHCESTRDLLLAIPGWASVHPFLKVLPVQWNYSIPYGILHAPNPSENVASLLAAARDILRS